MREVTEALRQQVAHELPEVEEIADAELRAKVIEAWAFAIARSSFRSIRDIPPAGNPGSMVLIRGDQNAGPLLAELSDTLTAILADPRVKEIAVTERGVRIVRQAGEGKRGEHLLLRQAHFEDAMVRRSEFAAVLTQLQSLRAVVDSYGRARAA